MINFSKKETMFQKETKRLLDPWFKYKQTVKISEEPIESFEWVNPPALRNIFNGIRDVLHTKPQLRENIKHYVGDDIVYDLGVVADFIPHIVYNEYILEKALLSYRSLLNNWKLWTKIYKENIVKYEYTQKQLPYDVIVARFADLSKPNIQIKYIAEQYGMDVEIYKRCLTSVYEEFDYVSKLNYCSLTGFEKMGSKPIFPGYIRRDIGNTSPFTFD